MCCCLTHYPLWIFHVPKGRDGQTIIFYNPGPVQNFETESKSNHSPKNQQYRDCNRKNSALIFHYLSPNPVLILTFEAIYSPDPIHIQKIHYNLDPVQSNAIYAPKRACPQFKNPGSNPVVLNQEFPHPWVQNKILGGS